MFLITIFFVTSADSGSLVMDTITAGGMASLQALTLVVGLPFTLVLLCMCVGLIKGLREELAIQT